MAGPTKKGSKKEAEPVKEPPKKVEPAEEEKERKITSFDIVPEGVDPYEQMLTYTQEIVDAMIAEEKHTAAKRITKVINYCESLHEDLKKKEQQYTELLPKIDDANERFNDALHISLNAERIVQELRKELETAWREADISRAREQKMQEQMAEMYNELTTLEGKVKKTQKSDDMGNMAEGPLSNKKETILRERDRLQAEVEELEKRLQMQRVYSENVDKRRTEVEGANSALMQELEATDANKIKFKRKIEDLQMNLNGASEENVLLKKKVATLEEQFATMKTQFDARGIELQQARTQYDKMKNETGNWNKMLLKKKIALQICQQENISLKDQVRNAIGKLKTKEYELFETKKDCKKSIANYDLLSTRLNKLRSVKEQMHKELETIRAEVSNNKKEFATHFKIIETERRDKEAIIHERDALRGTIARMGTVKKDLEHTIMLRNTTIERIQDEMSKKVVRIEELKQNFDQVVKERDVSAQEVEGLNDKVDDLQENILMLKEQLSDLKTKTEEKHMLYMRTKQNLESTNSERLLLRQQLQICGEEKENVRNQFNFVTYQIGQLKEEILSNQRKMLLLKLDIEKLSKEKQELKAEVLNITNVLNSTRNELKETKREADRLYKSLALDERRLMRQAIKLDNTIHEKDIIGTQMIRRNDEVIVLKEQITIIEEALQRGQMQYNHRIEDIKLMKQEIARLRSQRNILTRGLANTADMRQEVLQLQRLLRQERIINQALKEEATSPMNIHRWRPLKGRDPARMELIRKIVLLQKQFLSMKVNASKRELQLQECTKIYMLLKEHVEKLPSYDVKKDLLESQRVLRLRSKKLKAITAELNAKEFDIKSRDCTIEQLTTTLNQANKDLNQTKKKIQVISANQNKSVVITNNVVRSRTLGAGFKVKDVQ